MPPRVFLETHEVLMNIIGCIFDKPRGTGMVYLACTIHVVRLTRFSGGQFSHFGIRFDPAGHREILLLSSIICRTNCMIQQLYKF